MKPPAQHNSNGPARFHNNRRVRRTLRLRHWGSHHGSGGPTRRRQLGVLFHCIGVKLGRRGDGAHWVARGGGGCGQLWLSRRSRQKCERSILCVCQCRWVIRIGQCANKGKYCSVLKSFCTRIQSRNPKYKAKEKVALATRRSNGRGDPQSGRAKKV